MWVNINGNWIGRHSGKSWSSYWVTPNDLDDLELWFDSDNVINSFGKASQLTDLSGNDRHAVQVTVGNQPTITADALNGHNKLVFNGTSHRLVTASFTVTQPYTYFIVAKPASSVADDALIGTPGIPYSALAYAPVNNKLGFYAGTGINIEDATTELSLISALMRSTTSVFYRNSILKEITASPGTQDITTGIEVGGYANVDGGCGAMDFYEFILYSGALTAYQIMQITDYLQRKYDTDFGIGKNQPYNLVERFDSVLSNSIVISNEVGYDKRNQYGKYEFYTTDQSIIIKANPTLFSSVPPYTGIYIYENDVYVKRLPINSFEDRIVTLTSGNKKVTLIEGANASDLGGDANMLGTFLTSVKAYNYTKINQQSITEKIVSLGDSIIPTGGNTDNPVEEGCARLFMIEDGKEVACLGYGSGRIFDFAATVAKRKKYTGFISSLFSNVTTNKYLLISAGTNDWGLNSISAVDFLAMYGDLLDAINAADNTIKIWCISPILRGDAKEDATLDAYRSGISGLCTARSGYCTYIDGKPILSYPADYDDALHPSTLGHKKLKDAIYAVMYP